MKILVSVPNEGWIHKRVAMVLLQLLKEGNVRIIMPTHRPLENAQQHIVNEWIGESKEDYWLSIDADNPPMENPLPAIAHGKDFVGFPTPVWHFTGKIKHERPFYWNAYEKKGEEGYTEWPTKEGLQRVDAMGGGCFLASRRMFESPHLRYGAFLRKLNTDGTVDRGNDISFSERAIEAGFDLWCDYDRPCMHFNELDVSEVVRGFGVVTNG